MAAEQAPSVLEQGLFGCVPSVMEHGLLWVLDGGGSKHSGGR